MHTGVIARAGPTSAENFMTSVLRSSFMSFADKTTKNVIRQTVPGLVNMTAQEPTSTDAPGNTREQQQQQVQSAVQREGVQQQMLYSFCMAVLHLREAGLINDAGQACGLAGLATHLFWTEPANLAFVTLLTSGALHEIVAQPGLVRWKHLNLHVHSQLRLRISECLTNQAIFLNLFVLTCWYKLR